MCEDIKEKTYEVSEETKEAHRKEVEAFLYASKVNMARILARYASK